MLSNNQKNFKRYLKVRIFKQKVKKAFDNGSTHYDSNSILQKVVLENLLNLFFFEIGNKNHEFSLLDIGCGTGVGSKELSQKIFLKKMHLLDISSKMIEKAKLNLDNDKVKFIKHDFDSFDHYQNYDLLISNMSIHWSRNYLKLIQKILNSMKKDSILLLSFPNSNSFHDLKKDQKKFTNKFPKINDLKSSLEDTKYYYRIIKRIHKNEFNNVLLFFKSLKKIGANVSNQMNKPKGLFKLRKDTEKVSVSFDISYIFVRKIKN